MSLWMRSSFTHYHKNGDGYEPDDFHLECLCVWFELFQNAHAFGLSSTLARQKMKTKSRSLVVAMTKMMVATRQNYIHHLRFSESFASWPLRSCPPWSSISRWHCTKFLKRFFTYGHETRKVPGLICWWYRKISVLELQTSSGLTNVTIWWCNHRIVGVLRFWINPPSRRPQLAFNSSRTRVVVHLFLFVTLLTQVPREFSHNSGSSQLSPWENSHEATKQDYLLC